MAKRRKQSTWPAVLALICALLVGIGSWTSCRQQTTPPASTPAPAAIVPQSIRIASWNIRHLGSRTSTKDLSAVARIISENQFDIVAIQEVLDGKAVNQLRAILGDSWCVTGFGSESRSGEQLTFIYRGDRVSEIAAAQDLAAASVFERTPYVANMKAGNFDFELITVHLTWGDFDQRRDETRTLANVLPTRAAGQNEKDLIILGDFNEQKSRPNLTYMTEAGWQTVVKQGTNLSAREIYDHLLINSTVTSEYLGSTGVVCFDETLFGGNDVEAAEAVSDHRPVWADFATNRPDDD